MDSGNRCPHQVSRLFVIVPFVIVPFAWIYLESLHNRKTISKFTLDHTESMIQETWPREWIKDDKHLFVRLISNIGFLQKILHLEICIVLAFTLPFIVWLNSSWCLLCVVLSSYQPVCQFSHSWRLTSASARFHIANLRGEWLHDFSIWNFDISRWISKWSLHSKWHWRRRLILGLSTQCTHTFIHIPCF